MGLIYGYRNKTNNKWYVGQTIMPLEERHRLHISGAKNKGASDYNCLFHKKIRQYGIDNFELVVLEDNLPKEILDTREKFWIKEKNSFVQNGKGYNLTTGGQKRKDNEDYWDIRSAFSKEEVEKVKNKIRKGIDFTIIANQYNVSETLISQINRGKKYREKNETYPLFHWVSEKLSQDEVIQIIQELAEYSVSNAEIARWHNIDEEIVGKINLGKTYKQPGISYPIRKDPREVRANKIKQLLLTTNLTNKKIADKIGCDPSIVSNIKYGKVFFDKKLNYPLQCTKNL